MPGTRPSRIASAERAVSGLGRGGLAARGRLQPLTREAAGILIGEPGLGSEFEEPALEREAPLAVGDRLYYLEVPGSSPRESRSSEADVAFDLRTNEARITIFVSEAEAQRIALRLRRGEPLGASLAALRRIFVPALRAMVRGRKRSPRVAGAAPESEEFVGRLLPRPGLPRAAAAGLALWTGSALGAELAKAPKRFVEATENESDGLTIVVRMTNHPLLPMVARLLGGKPGAATRTTRSVIQLQRALAAMPTLQIDIHPGYRRAG